MAEQGKTPFHIEVLEERVGTVVKGKWTVERLIGVGGTAAVYEARHEIGRLDALKILHPDWAGDDTLVARFRREAEAVNRVNHPGLAEVRDIETTEDGIPFLVMELLEGENVSDILHRDGKLELEPALELIEQLLDVLIAAHAQDVIHRDIKPSNLFVDNQDRLRVVDFGVARVLVPSGKALTEAGTTLGTLRYMPPEQLKRSDVDPRADLYAVGATLHEMVTGQRVHEADSRQALATLILKEPAKTLVGVEDDIPDDVGKVVDRALAFLPERRYPDAATMQADLRAVREGEAPSYANARLEAGDDPRDKKPPKAAPANQKAAKTKAAKTKAEAPRAVASAVAEGGTERMAVPADEATTKKRAVVDDDETTHVRKTAGSEPPAAARAPGASVAKDDEDRPTPYWLLVVIALAALALWWGTRKDDVETDLPTTELPSATASVSSAPASVSSAPPESEGEGGALPGQDVEASASAPVPVDPPADKPPATPGGKPAPKPTSSSEPGKSDAGWPFPLPSGFPTSLPTTIPTSLPSSLPFPLPSAPPAPKPSP